MKAVFILLLLFITPSFSQIKNIDLTKKIDGINLYVKYVDSTANSLEEEISDGVIVTNHGRVDGKPTRKIFTRSRILKSSNQIVRICYTQRSDYDEDWNLYFFDGKLQYAERTIWKANQRKSSTVKFYFENEIEIYSTNSKNYPIEGIEILVKAEYLLKEARQ